ncbi:MAG: site-specific integrase, partial [Labrys sp. (in: a-proteobacteria)]
GVLGSRQINTLKPKDIVTLRNTIAGEDGERRVTANRVVAFLSAALTWGAKHEPSLQGRDNPCRGAQRFKEEARQRYLSADELGRLGEALRLAEKAPGLPWSEPKVHKNEPTEKRFTVLGEHVVGAIRLLVFTGCRLREILDLRWADVDLERGVLNLPKTKTGRRTVVLSGAAVAVLQDLAAVRLGQYVVPGLNPDRPRADLQRPWEAVCRHAGLEGVRLHDLRHGFASVGVQANLGLPIVGGLLGHKEASTTERYAHLHVDPMRRAADQIANHLAAALAGKAT